MSDPPRLAHTSCTCTTHTGEWFKLFMSEEHGEHSAPEWSVEERTVEAQRLREYFPPEYVDMEDREEECENMQQLVESDVQE